ncbi:MAG: M23 family metallopeptidase [Proteobacteria bacterium]|nr:M23 family metallopeptidase [Pseudomonadota bacterium]
MKKYMFYIILAIFLSSCATYGPFPVNKKYYGGPAPYGEGIHPGIDFGISRDTPIIAISDGFVSYVGTPEGIENGITVQVLHGEHFKSVYGHISKVFIKKGQWLKRGQLIGLSGASNNYGRTDYQHLHFGTCKPLHLCKKNCCTNYSQTYDPDKFWLGGQPQCFNPNMDYSVYSQKDITLPIACGEYAKELIAESKRKD